MTPPGQLEVATHLGVSLGTIEADWAHARAWLRRELAGVGGDDLACRPRSSNRTPATRSPGGRVFRIFTGATGCRSRYSSRHASRRSGGSGVHC